MAAAVGLLYSGVPGTAGVSTASGRRYALILLVCLALLAPLLQAAPASERERQLDNLLLQDCGSCHGLRMTGGLGPALTREALNGKPRDSLIATVTHGRPGTAMPGWKALLDEQDIAWLVDQLLEGYPRK